MPIIMDVLLNRLASPAATEVTAIELSEYCSAVLSFACGTILIYLAREGLLILWLSFVVVVIVVVIVVMVVMVVSRLRLFLYGGQL
jgi:hypothetical protein